MKRRVIQIADSTQLVSLPRKWAIRNGIKKGDELDIEIQGNKMIVQSKKGAEGEKVQADVSSLNEKFIRWMIFVFHKSGYDEMELTYKDAKIAKIIQDTINQGIMGFEIIEQTPKYSIIKNIATGLESEFETILKRIFLVTLSMAKSSYDIIKKGQFEDLKEIIVLESTNNKLTNFCERLLTKKGYKDPAKTNFVYVIVWQFEKIADDFRDLCRYLYENKSRISLAKETVSIFEKTINIIDTFYKAYYKKDDQILSSIVDEVTRVKKDITKVIKTGSEKDTVIVYYLGNACQKVLELCPSAVALRY